MTCRCLKTTMTKFWVCTFTFVWSLASFLQSSFVPFATFWLVGDSCSLAELLTLFNTVFNLLIVALRKHCKTFSRMQTALATVQSCSTCMIRSFKSYTSRFWWWWWFSCFCWIFLRSTPFVRPQEWSQSCKILFILSDGELNSFVAAKSPGFPTKCGEIAAKSSSRTWFSLLGRRLRNNEWNDTIFFNMLLKQQFDCLMFSKKFTARLSSSLINTPNQVHSNVGAELFSFKW